MCIGQMEKVKYWATSHALLADELYIKFPTKKYMSVSTEELPAQYGSTWRNLYG